MSRNRDTEFEEVRQIQGKGRPLATVLVASLVFYAASALLNGPWLHREASLLTYGPARTFWLRVSAPLAEASHVTQADRLRLTIEKTIGKTPPNPQPSRIP